MEIFSRSIFIGLIILSTVMNIAHAEQIVGNNHLDINDINITAPDPATGLTTMSAANDQNNQSNQNSPAVPERKILYSITPADYVWKNGPASFPRGASYTILEGDPYTVGPYTIRIKLPPHYQLPSHAHDDLEEITVISGTLYIALGDKMKDTEGMKLPAGAFTVLGAHANHFVWTENEGTIIQIQGMAPRVTLYVDQKNDPTGKKIMPSGSGAAVTDQKKLNPSVDKSIKTTSFQIGLRRKTVPIPVPGSSPLKQPIVLPVPVPVLAASEKVTRALGEHFAKHFASQSQYKQRHALAFPLKKAIMAVSHQGGFKLAMTKLPKSKLLVPAKRPVVMTAMNPGLFP